MILIWEMARQGINIIMIFMLLGVSAVMLAGAGAVFEEQLGLTKRCRCFYNNFFILFSHDGWYKRTICS